MDQSQSFVIHTFDSSANVHRAIHTRPTRFFTCLLLRLLLPRDKGLAVARSDAHVGEDLRRSQVDGRHVSGLVGNLLLEFLRGCG